MAEVTVKVENIPAVRALLDDAYECIALLQSEAWDLLSPEAREEAELVMERLDEMGRGS